MAEGQIPHTRHVRGSNYAFISVFEDRLPGRAIVICGKRPLARLQLARSAAPPAVPALPALPARASLTVLPHQAGTAGRTCIFAHQSIQQDALHLHDVMIITCMYCL